MAKYKDMQDNEIIKALECCTGYVNDCFNCPYRKDEFCDTSFPRDALDLINRQKAENERLKNYNENLLSANTALSNEVLETKSEAIKEFAERLKNLSRFTNSDKLYIDNLVKEMVGENNA